ncbi:protein piccolo-like [Sinocyclocheilus grahami]|uniref:protein piccolo-like n=1 Tax=Sinocyclocheilus grahami TaxID=75366 RepID=UPI0007ACEE0A|nr:PREDICTED: protein piccolo-like [Sinocyclocheilus grahami]
MIPAVSRLLCLRQGDRPTEDYLMPCNTPHWSLEQYIDVALRMSGSAFTVSVVEEEHSTSPKSSVVMPTKSEPVHVMPAKPRSAHIMSAKPQPAHVTPATPQPAHVMSAMPKPAHIMPATPGPAHIMPVNHHVPIVPWSWIEVVTRCR